MKKSVKLLSISALSFILSVSLAANGLNFNSIGAKSSAMGTAFIGLADDFSAVFFNPAGLTQQDKATLTFFANDLIATNNYKFDLVGLDAQAGPDHNPTGALAYFKPIKDNLVVGVAVYVPSGLGVTYDGDDLLAFSGGISFDWKSKIFVVTFAPTIAYKVSDVVSLGLSLNINYGTLHTKQPGLGQYEEDISGLAFGATVGALFKPSDKFSFGLSFRSPSKITLKGDASMSGAGIFGLPTTVDAERKATWPLVAGAGIAFKPTDKLTFVADVVYTQWSKMDTLPVEYSDATWQAVFGADSEIHMQWDDVWSFKFGLEYQVNDTWAVRAGYYSDPTPSPLDTMNILIPQLDLTAFTFGVGYKTGKVTIDLGFEYIMGSDVDVPPLTYLHAMPGNHDLKILVPGITVTINL